MRQGRRPTCRHVTPHVPVGVALQVPHSDVTADTRLSCRVRLDRGQILRCRCLMPDRKR